MSTCPDSPLRSPLTCGYIMLVAPYRWVFEHLRAVLKPAIAFEFWSTLIVTMSFAPASGWVLNRLVAASGQYAISDRDLVAFFLSVSGSLFLLLQVGFVLAFWFAEQVGLLIIVVHAAFGTRAPVSSVLWDHLARLPALLHLGLLQAAGYLVAGIPFGVGIGLTYRLLLWEWDIYYYLSVQPLVWWIALAIAGTLATAYLVLAAWLYTRWLFAVPALVFEHATPTGALRNSWQQTRGRFWELGCPLAICWLVAVAGSLAMTWLIRAAATSFLIHPGLALPVMVPAVVGTLALITIVELLWLVLAKMVHVMLMAGFYLETTEVELTSRAPAAATKRLSPAGLKRLGWLTAGIVIVIGIGAGIAFLERLNINRTVAITAHRGSKRKAPENTLSALRQAIADGADYAEIDVQTTADGVVVLLHDGDLRRVAALNRQLHELNYDELREIDIGSWFAPEFSRERIATLQEAMEVARGRIKLNIELKFNRSDPTLAEKVGHLIQRNGFAADCVVSSLNFPALTEIKRVVPDLTTGFIVFQAVGNLSKMDADFLSLNAARATPSLVRDVHRRGKEVHVWTVDEPSHVLSMLEVGVDNIITGDPQGVRRLLETWQELSDSEKIAVMLRNLIAGTEPLPSSEL